jgi:hypothetical protein
MSIFSIGFMWKTKGDSMAKEKRDKEERPEEYTEVPDFPIGGNDI